MKYSPHTYLFGLLCLFTFSNSSVSQSSPSSLYEGEIWPKKPIQFAKKGGSGGSDCAVLNIENQHILIEGIVYTSLSNFLIGTYYDMSLHAAIAIKIFSNSQKEILLTEIHKEINYGIDGIPLLPEIGSLKCSMCPSYPEYHIGYIEDNIDISEHPILGTQTCDEIESYHIEATLLLMYALEDYPNELHPINPEDYSSCQTFSIWPKSCYQHLQNFEKQTGCFNCDENNLNLIGAQEGRTNTSANAFADAKIINSKENTYYIFDLSGKLICQGKNHSKADILSRLPRIHEVYVLIEQNIHETKASKIIPSALK